MGLADGVKWNFMVELLPRWLAPNAVTLIGFGFILTNVICLEIWLPDLVGPGPSWLYYSFAFGLWACVGNPFGRCCKAQRADYRDADTRPWTTSTGNKPEGLVPVRLWENFLSM